MRKLTEWIAGWWITLRIKRNNPELWKVLCEEFREEDYVRVPRPDGGSLLIRKNAVETMRRLGEESQR